MRNRLAVFVKALLISLAFPSFSAAQKPPLTAGQFVAPDDPVMQLVGRLDLERYKATIRSLTQFGDRRQGTDRNRAAVDWIEAQLKSYGCATERHHYVYTPPPKPGGATGPVQ